MVGDVVGRTGRYFFMEQTPELKQAQNIDDDAAYANLFNSYRAELLSWFAKNQQGLSEAERAAVMDYGLLEASNDYGFSKNQLLF